MAFKRGMDLCVALLADSLAQNFFSAKVAEQIEHGTADSGSGGGESHVEQHVARLVIDVTGNYGVHGQAHESGINARDGEYSPRSERGEKAPKPRRIVR